MEKSGTFVSDFFLYFTKRLERNDEIWYNMIRQFKSFTEKQDCCPNEIISDETHRTKLGIGRKLKKPDKGIETAYGFAQYCV